MHLSIKHQLFLKMATSIFLLLAMIFLIVFLLVQCLKKEEDTYYPNEEAEALILISEEHPCPENYYTQLTSMEGKMISQKMKDHLKAMMKQSCTDLVCLTLATGYLEDVSVLEEPDSLEVSNWFFEESSSSQLEHETGLAIDFSKGDQTSSNQKMWDWLENHAHLYGFIRHSEEEPWHYRFVGMEHAKIIKEQNLTLETYLQTNEKEGI